MNQIGDEDIIDRVIAGETVAFNQIVLKYQHYAYTVALKVLQNKEDAEEVAHDSFVKAYQNLKKFNREAKFSTWLYRIVFNTAISRKRKTTNQKEELSKADHLGIAPSSKMEMDDKQQYINQALSDLIEADRAIIVLFYLEEKSLEEMVQITGFKLNTLKVRLHRARKRMAKTLKMILKEEALSL